MPMLSTTKTTEVETLREVYTVCCDTESQLVSDSTNQGAELCLCTSPHCDADGTSGGDDNNLDEYRGMQLHSWHL